ncbi:MAG: zinc carboxypeptidase, partial [Bacteroidota bacterium]
VTEFSKYFTESAANPPGKYKTYIVSGNNPKGKLRALTQLLDRNGIEYTQAGRTQGSSVYSYQEGRDIAAGFTEGDLIISAYQPRAILTQVLFDPNARLEDSVTYDITAWSLPMAYGLEAYASTQQLKTGDDPFALPTFNDPLGKIKLEAVYAFVLPWTDFSSAQFLAAAIEAGLKVRTAGAAGTIDGQRFPAGSIVINKGDNRKVPGFANTVARLVREHEVDILPVMTGFSSSGFDLGSPNYSLIGQPRIATLAGDEVQTNEFGQVWYFFEQSLNYPIHIYDFDNLGDLADDEIDILILPEGYFSLSDQQARTLTSWVRDGGKLVAIGNANRALARRDEFGLSDKESVSTSDSEELLDYGGAERRFISNYIPGAIVDTEMDATHPLSFGIGERYAALKTNSLAYAYLDGGETVGRVRKNPRINGFVGANARKQIEESLSIGVESMGRGEVIYLVDNPLFRGFWEQGKFLMANALFQEN